MAVLAPACRGSSAAAEVPTVVVRGQALAVDERERVPSPRPLVLSPAAIAWRRDLAEARREAAATGADLLVFVYAAWSVESLEIRRTVWRDREVVEAAGAYLPLLLDVSEAEDPKSEHALAALRVARVPTILRLGPRGKERGRIEGAATAEAVIELISRR